MDLGLCCAWSGKKCFVPSIDCLVRNSLPVPFQVDFAEASMAEVSIPLEDPLRVLLKPSPTGACRELT